MKRGGGRRYYRPEDMALLRTIRSLLYGEGYTIRGVQRLLKEQGVRAVMALTATPGEPASHKGVLQSADALEVHERGQDDGAAAELFAEMTVTLRAALGDIEDARRILRAAQAH